MALIPFELASNLADLFNPSKPPSNTHESAYKISIIIVEYLKNAELNPIVAPVIVPSPAGPVPDPTFVPGILKLLNPASLESQINILIKAFQEAFDKDKFSDPASFALIDTAISAYIPAAFANQTFYHLDYLAIGSTVLTKPAVLNIQASFKKKNDNHQQAANDLALRIHSFITSHAFTGPYSKAGIPGPAPHFSYLI